MEVISQSFQDCLILKVNQNPIIYSMCLPFHLLQLLQNHIVIEYKWLTRILLKFKSLLLILSKVYLSNIPSIKLMSIYFINLTLSIKSFLLKQELLNGIRLSIVIFLPKKILKLPKFSYKILYKVGSVSDKISLIIERMILLSLSYSVS